MRRLAIVMVLVFLLFFSLAQSATLRVPSQYDTIGEAIDAARQGDTVLVADGAYEIPPSQGRFAQFFYKSNIVLASEHGKASTILSGPLNNYEQDLIAFYYASDCMVTGFTLSNAVRRVISISQSSNISIQDCDISGGPQDGIRISLECNNIEIVNTSIHQSGLGINTYGFNVVLSNNRIYENLTGIYFYGGTATVAANDIYDNQNEGLRMDLGWEASIVVESNVIHDNMKEGLRYYSMYANPAILENNTISGNGSYGAFVIAGEPVINKNIIANNASAGIAVGESGNPYITCNDVWGNAHYANGNYVGYITDQTGYNGNISTDPFFCNASAGDYSLAANSPALLASCGPMGAIPAPGCSNQTAVEHVTWGSIKALYR